MFLSPSAPRSGGETLNAAFGSEYFPVSLFRINSRDDERPSLLSFRYKMGGVRALGMVAFRDVIFRKLIPEGSAEAYAFAIVCVAVAAVVRWVAGFWFEGIVPLATFFPAVLLAALIGGIGPSHFCFNRASCFRRTCDIGGGHAAKNYSSQMNVCSVRPFSYGRTTASAALWMVLGRRISGHPRARCTGPVNIGQHSRRRHVEASMSKANEWDLLRRQFDTLMHDENVGAESIEEIFDVQFRRRFTELIDQTARRNSASRYNWPRH
jgi:hypothetical protein